MARLQILELPEGSGDDRPPFVLVVDQYQPQRYLQGVDDKPQAVDEFAGVAEQIGARGILVFQETVEIPANDVPVDAEEVEVSDTDFTEMASAVHRALGIDMTEAGAKMDIAGWLLAACRELEKSEAARAHLRSERAGQAAELEQLRAGEEPVTDTAVRPSPGQWIWQWNRATPEKRLNMAAQILEGMAKANDCWMSDHEARLTDLQAEVQRLRPQPDGAEKPDA